MTLVFSFPPHEFDTLYPSRLWKFPPLEMKATDFTQESVKDAKTEYDGFEDVFFGKIKETIMVAASHEMITCGIAAGIGILAFKKPRRFIYHRSLRLFLSEEALLSRAEVKVRELRESVDVMRDASEKLERRLLHATDELKRGRTKLRQAGKQIRGVIGSTCKIEKHSSGLKDLLPDLPRLEASRFRAQISKATSEAKREKNVMLKQVRRINNLGISI